MGLKVLRISFLFYEQIMKKLIQMYQSENVFSYQEKKQKIFDGFYMYFDSFSSAMNFFGYDAEELFYDFKELQYQWAYENGFIFTENWKEEILLKQIEVIRPDILYFQDINAFSFQTLNSLKKRFSFLKRIIIFRGYPLVNKQLFQKLAVADILLVGTPKLLEPCRRQGLQPFLLYHSFDPRILEKVKKTKHVISLSFCGSSGFGNHFFHLSRYYFLKELLEKTDVQMWIEENETVNLSLLKALKRRVKKQIYPFLFACKDHFLERLQNNLIVPSKLRYSTSLVLEYKKDEKRFIYPKNSLSSLFPQKCNPPLFGKELYQKLCSSDISLNKHALVAAPYVDNLRLFDATGVGSCLVTERGHNLCDLFKEDEEVVCYSSKEECLEKIEYLKKNENVRSSIALKGQKRTLLDHNAIKRAEALDKIIKLKFYKKDG